MMEGTHQIIGLMIILWAPKAARAVSAPMEDRLVRTEASVQMADQTVRMEVSAPMEDLDRTDLTVPTAQQALLGQKDPTGHLAPRDLLDHPDHRVLTAWDREPQENRYIGKAIALPAGLATILALEMPTAQVAVPASVAVTDTAPAMVLVAAMVVNTVPALALDPVTVMPIWSVVVPVQVVLAFTVLVKVAVLVTVMLPDPDLWAVAIESVLAVVAMSVMVMPTVQVAVMPIAQVATSMSGPALAAVRAGVLVATTATNPTIVAPILETPIPVFLGQSNTHQVRSIEICNCTAAQMET